jgi:hypothetical protein
VAYYTGIEFKPGPRIPARTRTYWDVWGQNLGHLNVVVEQAHPADGAQGRCRGDTRRSLGTKNRPSTINDLR